MVVYQLKSFAAYLRSQEKSENTVEKYLRDAGHFLRYMEDRELKLEQVVRYKEDLVEHYKISSVNSMLIAVNCYLRFIGREDCCVKACRVQRQTFREEEKELSREEYRRLVSQAWKDGKKRLFYILQTLAMTGIRIGELKYITAESLRQQMVRISSKGKVRIILLPPALTAMLGSYCREAGIREGSIFITRKGRPMDRRNIWVQMKGLCQAAGVSPGKVFPHNLRHLFAQCYYEKEKDLAHLADYLGHSSIETTRRYTMISAMEACLNQLDLGLMMKWEELGTEGEKGLQMSGMT